MTIPATQQPASWVVLHANGKAFCETFSRRVADTFRKQGCRVVPIDEYLGTLNRAIREKAAT